MRRFLPLLLWLGLAVQAKATITPVQAASANTGSAAGGAITWTTTALTANNYVVLFYSGNTNGAKSMFFSDASGTSNYIGGEIARNFDSTGSVVSSVYLYKIVVGGATSVNIAPLDGTTFTGSAILWEISGKNLTPDVWKNNTGSGTALDSGTTATTNYANELWLASLCTRGQQNLSPNTAWATSPPTNGFSLVTTSGITGMTSTFTNVVNGDRYIAAVYKIVTATAAANVGIASAIPTNRFAGTIITLREVPQVITSISSD